MNRSQDCFGVDKKKKKGPFVIESTYRSVYDCRYRGNVIKKWKNCVLWMRFRFFPFTIHNVNFSFCFETIFRRSEKEQQVQLVAHVPVHDGWHDHTAGVRRAGPVGRQGADHRQTGAGPVRHHRPQEAVGRRRRQQPRVRQPRRRRRPLPQESARRTGGRVQHGVQLVHARLRGTDPEHHDRRDPPVDAPSVFIIRIIIILLLFITIRINSFPPFLYNTRLCVLR